LGGAQKLMLNQNMAGELIREKKWDRYTSIQLYYNSKKNEIIHTI
jgi:hypothetical protein